MRSKLLCGGLVLATLCGCAGRPTILPPSDKALRKTSAEFAADAAKRHPYRADAPRGGQAVARAEVHYGLLNQIDLVNLSNEPWDDVEVWVNQNYVVHVDHMEPNKLETINFQMLFDDQGKSFPTHGQMVNKLELYRSGKMYDVTLKLSD